VKKLIGITFIITFVVGFYFSRPNDSDKQEHPQKDLSNHSKSLIPKSEITKLKKSKSQGQNKLAVTHQRKNVDRAPSAESKPYFKQQDLGLSAKSNKRAVDKPLAQFFSTDDVVTMGGKTFMVARSLRAMATDEFEQSSEVELMRYGGFVIFSSDQESGLRVLSQEGKGNVLVATGRIIVSGEFSMGSESNKNFEVDRSLSHLGVSIVTLPAGSDLIHEFNQIEGQAKELELVQGVDHEK
jgi:hypothetical protein